MIQVCLRLNGCCKILFSRQTNRLISRMLSKNCATVRLVDNEKMTLSFYYKINNNDKLFNFCRERDEQMVELFAKIRHKLTQVVDKKNKKKMKAIADSAPIEVTEDALSISLHYENSAVDELLTNGEAWKNGSILKIGDNNYDVVINAPAIKNLLLPKCLLAGIEIYPSIEVEFGDENNCRYMWFKRRLPKEKQRKNSGSSEESDFPLGVGGWFPVSEEFTYKPDTSDIGRHIKLICVPRRNGFEGIESHIESKSAVEPGPGFCPFEERHEFTKDITAKDHFRCISYNILADLYADSDFSRTVLFPYCPPHNLDMNYRKNLLFKELVGYNGDVVCLQEVDRSLFKKELRRIMHMKALEGIFHEKGEQSGEGLACFYRVSKFQLVSHSSVSLSQVVDNEPIFRKFKDKISKNEEYYRRFKDRKTVLQYALLKSTENPGKAILVGNTHLYWHPLSDDIRLAQSFVCVTWLEHLLRQYKSQHKDLAISPLLFGDFNSCPEFGVYRLMTTGFVDADCDDWRSYSNEFPSDVSLSHSLSFSSACGTPEYTNYTYSETTKQGFKGCLDYIFYDNQNLTVEEVIPFPSHEQVTQFEAIPNAVFPSDHLALVATLKWSQSSV